MTISYFSICLEGLRKPTKNSIQDYQSPCQYLNGLFPEYEARALATLTRRFLCDCQVWLVTSHCFAGTESETDKCDVTNFIIYCCGPSRWCLGISRVCREFEQWLSVGGRAERMVGGCTGRERLGRGTRECCWHRDTGPVSTRGPVVPDGA